MLTLTCLLIALKFDFNKFDKLAGEGIEGILVILLSCALTLDYLLLSALIKALNI